MIGPLSCGSLQAVTTPGALPCPPQCAGIVGLDLLSRLAFLVDFERCRLRVGLSKDFSDIKSLEAYLKAQDMKRIALKSLPGSSGLFALQLQLQVPGNRRSVDCLGVLDLGAPFSVCSKATAQALGLGSSELKSSGKFVTGMDGSPVEVQSSCLRLALGPKGGVELQTEIVVGDLPIFQALQVALHEPIAILGLDVLQHRGRVAVATARNALWM